MYATHKQMPALIRMDRAMGNPVPDWLEEM